MFTLSLLSKVGAFQKTKKQDLLDCGKHKVKNANCNYFLLHIFFKAIHPTNASPSLFLPFLVSSEIIVSPMLSVTTTDLMRVKHERAVMFNFGLGIFITGRKIGFLSQHSSSLPPCSILLALSCCKKFFACSQEHISRNSIEAEIQTSARRGEKTERKDGASAIRLKTIFCFPFSLPDFEEIVMWLERRTRYRQAAP